MTPCCCQATVWLTRPVSAGNPGHRGFDPERGVPNDRLRLHTQAHGHYLCLIWMTPWRYMDTRAPTRAQTRTVVGALLWQLSFRCRKVWADQEVTSWVPRDSVRSKVRGVQAASMEPLLRLLTCVTKHKYARIDFTRTLKHRWLDFCKNVKRFCIVIAPADGMDTSGRATCAHFRHSSAASQMARFGNAYWHSVENRALCIQQETV